MAEDANTILVYQQDALNPANNILNTYIDVCTGSIANKLNTTLEILSFNFSFSMNFKICVVLICDLHNTFQPFG